MQATKCFKIILRKDECMKFKKAIVAGTVAAAFIGSVLNVSAAEMTTKDYMNVLKKDGKESLIIDVEAYKAAYGDLAAAFGDDWGAYIEHYLTFGVYEGRMEGALFDPLTYAAAYGDIKAAYGDNIPAIANHYKTVGITENRTIGTANGYADIATAEKAGAVVSAPRVNSPVNVAVNSGTEAKGENTVNNGNVNEANNGAGVVNNNNGSAASNGTGAGQNNSAVNTGSAGNSANTDNGNSNSVNNANVNSSTVSVNTDAGNANNNVAAVNPSVNNGNNYQHVTSIYHDDGETLWRKEYYDENNKLSEYSSVTDVDNSTNSYTENVYKWDDEKDEEVLQRTDTYVNGELVSSERP